MYNIFDQVDFHGNDLSNTKLKELSSAPTPVGGGHVYYDDTTEGTPRFLGYNGTSWKPLNNVNNSSTNYETLSWNDTNKYFEPNSSLTVNPNTHVKVDIVAGADEIHSEFIPTKFSNQVVGATYTCDIIQTDTHFNVVGGQQDKKVTHSADGDFTLDLNDYSLFVDSSLFTASRKVNLPAVGVDEDGFEYELVHVKGDIATNNIILVADAGDTVDGVPTRTLDINDSWYKLRYNHASLDWEIVGEGKKDSLAMTNCNNVVFGDTTSAPAIALDGAGTKFVYFCDKGTLVSATTAGTKLDAATIATRSFYSGNDNSINKSSVNGLITGNSNDYTGLFDNSIGSGSGNGSTSDIQNSIVSGDTNTLTASTLVSDSIVGGNTNDIGKNANNIRYNLIVGNASSIWADFNIDGNLIGGSGHAIDGNNLYRNLIVGNAFSQTFATAELHNNVIAGDTNTALSEAVQNCLIGGNNNDFNITTDSCVVSKSGTFNTARYSLIGGDTVTMGSGTEIVSSVFVGTTVTCNADLTDSMVCGTTRTIGSGSTQLCRSSMVAGTGTINISDVNGVMHNSCYSGQGTCTADNYYDSVVCDGSGTTVVAASDYTNNMSCMSGGSVTATRHVNYNILGGSSNTLTVTNATTDILNNVVTGTSCSITCDASINHNICAGNVLTIDSATYANNVFCGNTFTNSVNTATINNNIIGTATSLTVDIDVVSGNIIGGDTIGLVDNGEAGTLRVRNSLIVGINNDVANADNCLIAGDNTAITGEFIDAANSIFVGKNVTYAEFNDCVIGCAYNSSFDGTNQGSLLMGQNHQMIGPVEWSVVCGDNIDLPSISYGIKRSFVSGQAHSIGGIIHDSLIIGTSHEVDGSTNGMVLAGNDHTLLNVQGSMIVGWRNKCTFVGTGKEYEYSMVYGDNNEVDGNMRGSILGGHTNRFITTAPADFNDVRYSYIGGEDNTFTDVGTLTVTTALSTHAFVHAKNCTATGPKAMDFLSMWGSDHTITNGRYNTLFGSFHTITESTPESGKAYYNFVIGDSNTITDATYCFLAGVLNSITADVVNSAITAGTSLTLDQSNTTMTQHLRVANTVQFQAVTTKTAAYLAVVPQDFHIVCDTASVAAFTVTLPDAAPIGTVIVVSDGVGNAGTDNITVSRETTNTIIGATTYLINSNWESATFHKVTATSWLVI